MALRQAGREEARPVAPARVFGRRQQLGPLRSRRAHAASVRPWRPRRSAVSASDAGVYDWEDFRQGLIAEIGAWEAQHGRNHVEGGEWRYYARWLTSLERLLAEKGVVAREELDSRLHELAREDDHGHDHDDHEGVL